MQRTHVAAAVLTLLAVGFAVFAAAPAAVAKEVKDHPLISRYPGSQIAYLPKSSVKEFDEIALPMGPVAPNGAEEGVWQ